MKNRYTLEILAYDGRILNRAIEADNIQNEGGTIQFVSDGGDRWIPIAVYPADKTIITKIEKLK
jgi:hypothetical protein